MDREVEEEMIALLPRLRRFAFSLTGSWPDADDLVQTTCARAIERIDQWQVGTRLDSWLYRIAQNLHRNDLKKGGVRAAHLREVDPNAVDYVSQNTAVDRMAIQELDAAMSRLPVDQRAVLLLVAVEGQSYQDAAEVLGVSPGTVASRVSRARTNLAEMMDGERR